MENCVDIVMFGASELVVIKQPGSQRNPHGRPVIKIECSPAEAAILAAQIHTALTGARATLKLGFPGTDETEASHDDR